MLTVEHITKKFAGVTALQDVSMQFLPGHVHALIGENGAGKSTLMKILSGVYQDYEGQIQLNGQTLRFSHPREAQAAGIAIIHQELNLIPYLSITENIFLGRELLTPWGTLDKKEMRRQAVSLLQKLQLPLGPDRAVSSLKVGQQQVVEIAKALLTDSKAIIMDEPTSAISESEVQVLFGMIRQLKAENKVIVYISHKLDELTAIADHYTVLRDGRCIESGNMKGMRQEDIIRRMVGREITVMRSRTDAPPSGEVLTVKNVSLRSPSGSAGPVKNVSFSLGKGEIVGLFGLMGAGRTELLEMLFGLHPAFASGEVLLDRKLVSFNGTRAAIRAGMALVPEDRKKDGLVLGMDVDTNINLTTLENSRKLGLLHDRRLRALAQKYRTELSIKTTSGKLAVSTLSGGNQQKIVLAKWLATHPKVLMLDEPTRGIDIGAKTEIYKLIFQLAATGLGVLIVSSELPEILAVSDRVLVMSEGRVTADLPVREAAEDVILRAAIPKSI